jgi:hypothetical protein
LFAHADKTHADAAGRCRVSGPNAAGEDEWGGGTSGGGGDERTTVGAGLAHKTGGLENRKLNTTPRQIFLL